MTQPEPDPVAPTQVEAGQPEPEFAARAIAQVLRPLTRLAIDHGLQLPAIIDMVKRAMVDEATQTFALEDKNTSDSRIALLTGVHRKDVKRLRGEMADPADSPPLMSAGATVVARWISDPRFLNADQSPRLLARTPKRGSPGQPDFTELVAEISRDVGARAMLDELVRLGAVEVRDDGYVALRASAFVPQGRSGEPFYFQIANVSDHLATAVHNLSPSRRDGLMLEQSAFAEDLSPEQAHSLQQRARQLWATVLKQFLQTATLAWQRSENSPAPKRRIKFGVYFHDGEQPPEAPTPNSRAKAKSKKSGARTRKPKV